METNPTINTPPAATSPTEDSNRIEQLIAQAEQRGYERALAERADAEVVTDCRYDDDSEGFLANLRPDFWES